MQNKTIEHLDDAKKVVPAGARFWRHTKPSPMWGAGVHISASATGVGSCGDRLRVDLRIRKGILEEVQCNPQGCVYTQACGNALCKLAQGRTIEAALQIQPEDVALELECLPQDHMHCARLAVNTLGEAIADYYYRHGAEAGTTADKE